MPAGLSLDVPAGLPRSTGRHFSLYTCRYTSLYTSSYTTLVHPPSARCTGVSAAPTVVSEESPGLLEGERACVGGLPDNAAQKLSGRAETLRRVMRVIPGEIVKDRIDHGQPPTLAVLGQQSLTEGEPVNFCIPRRSLLVRDMNTDRSSLWDTDRSSLWDTGRSSLWDTGRSSYSVLPAGLSKKAIPAGLTYGIPAGLTVGYRSV